MNKQDFLNQLHEFLEITSVPTLNEGSNIKKLEEYDSMMILTIIAFVDDNFNKTLSAEQLNAMQSVEDLINLIGSENFT